MIPDINIFAVIASVVASMIVGSIWYSPKILGKKFMEEQEKSIKRPDNYNPGMSMGKLYGIQTLVSLVGAYSLALIIKAIGISTIGGAIIAGLILSIGIIATNGYGSVLWGHSSKKLFLISTGGNVIATIVMSIILTLWQ